MLKQIKGEYRNNYILKPLTWLKVGGPAEVFFKPLDCDALANFLSQNQLPVFVLGAGSNVIIRDNGIEGVVIKLGRNFTNIEFTSNNNLVVGAGCLNFNLAKFCRENIISGFEFLSGIPGTIGGGVAMNAGAYGSEFKDIVIAIEAIDCSGKRLILSNEEIGFRHRSNNLPSDLVITKAIFKTKAGDANVINSLIDEINIKRLSSQPIKERTGGSTFVNPAGYSAWKLIDKSSLRGYRIGDAKMSQLHCNFMVNVSNASAQDLENLGEFVRKKVFVDSNILLEWEIKRIGKKHA
jgi:UDP-N-acetylmuramate dehydrogenase